MSAFLHLLGHSLGSAVIWDVFQGRWHRTAISGILLWRGVLSRAGCEVFSLGLGGGMFSLSGWVGGCSLFQAGWGFVFFAFFRFFYGFRTCRVGHLECAYLISHISNFSSKFCNIDCLTLHPPRTVVCRLLQTRVDVHVLVIIIQGYCFSNMPFQEPEQKLLPKKKLLPKNMSFCQPSRLPSIPHQQWVHALEKY